MSKPHVKNHENPRNKIMDNCVQKDRIMIV